MNDPSGGGTFGPSYRRNDWGPPDAKRAPFPSSTAPVAGSLGTPVYDSGTHGPLVDPQYAYASR